MRASELGGLVVAGRPRLVTSVVGWTTGDPMRLIQAGFVRGLREGYGAKADDGISALSSVAEFRTAAGARDEVASEVGSVHPPAPTYVAFPVAGIPRAHGFRQEAPGSVGYFVMFNDGRFQYEIGFGGSPSADHRHGPAIKAQAIAAAQALYSRVHGRPVGVAAADGGSHETRRELEPQRPHREHEPPRQNSLGRASTRASPLANDGASGDTPARLIWSVALSIAQGWVARLFAGLGFGGGAHRLSSTAVSRLICAGWCRMTGCAR